MKCLRNKGLPEPAHGLYYTEHTVFEVTVGETYPVYGISMFNRGLTLLLRDDTGKPNWQPIELFEVVDGRLPDGWKFATRDQGEAYTQAIFGYPRLVDDEGHEEALIEREPDAMRVFLDYVASAANDAPA
ncbi:hypothetical protein [Kibdelosporangium persicum]|uniref:hypothetical protein n=1 Tax=Kibdelosporangium persicum TaxID=2698649 RepID=UPI0015651115|nr:hypothetical protein [Kibdelosporangium persicum]